MISCLVPSSSKDVIKGEYLVRNTTNSEQMVYSVISKLHVSAFIGHLQVSTIIEESIYAVKIVWGC